MGILAIPSPGHSTAANRFNHRITTLIADKSPDGNAVTIGLRIPLIVSQYSRQCIDIGLCVAASGATARANRLVVKRGIDRPDLIGDQRNLRGIGRRAIGWRPCAVQARVVKI